MSEQEAPKDMAEVVKFAEKKFTEISPAGMNFHKESNFLLQILRNNANLMQAASETPRSAIDVLTNVAALGLSLNPAKKEAYVLSRNVKTGKKEASGKDIWETRLYLEPSYMGLNKVAIDSECVEWVQARVVRKADTFVDNGVGLRPTHTYDAFATNEERGEIVGAYCVAKSGEDYLTNILNKERLDSIRGRSETWKRSLKQGGTGAGTWLTDEEEMCMKATMRNGFKTWPKKTARMEQAVHISNDNEGFEELTTTPTVSQHTADQKAYYDQMIETSDAIGMFLFTTSLEEGVEIALYNSFPAREGIGKGKYQEIVRNLQASGRAQIEDCQLAITEAAKSGDDMGVKELIDDLPKEAVEFIIDKVDIEIGKFIRELMQ